VVANLDHSAKHLLNGLTEEPAWPTLRGHMLLLAAAGADPVAELFSAAATRELTSAHDQAAVIDWRIVNEVVAGGPLPWLSGIPHRLAADPDWGPSWTPDHSLLLSSPTRSAATPQRKRRPGRRSRALQCRPS
jgi:hypothetical protein